MLLAFSGLELAMAAKPATVERDGGGHDGMLVMLSTAGTGLAMGSGVAFLVGVAAHLTLRVARACGGGGRGAGGGNGTSGSGQGQSSPRPAPLVHHAQPSEPHHTHTHVHSV